MIIGCINDISEFLCIDCDCQCGNDECEEFRNDAGMNGFIEG